MKNQPTSALQRARPPSQLRRACAASSRAGMRREGWHYNWTGTYMVTLTLEDRSKPILGRLVGACDEARVELSEIGEAVATCWKNITEFAPEIEPLDYQIMPDHFHGILHVKREMKKPLGAAIGFFKVRCTQAYRAIKQAASGLQPAGGAQPAGSRCAACCCSLASSLWAKGYYDSIAFNASRLARQIAYIKDNPRRLAIKRANRELFKVVQRVPFNGGYFSAIGNMFLLEAPQFVQVQCSRSITAEELQAKIEATLDAAGHGAVIVSPCISPGEREIARAVFEAKGRLIAIKNKGFSPYYKPSGEMFDACAEGRILQLAPINWPYTPGIKKLTRIEACVMNRLAQLICGEDAVEINYKGMTPVAIEEEVRRASTPQQASRQQAAGAPTAGKQRGNSPLRARSEPASPRATQRLDSETRARSEPASPCLQGDQGGPL